MKTWFVTRSTNCQIDNCKVIAESEQHVTILIDTPSGEKIERLRPKVASWEQYHPTFSDAREFLVKRQRDRVSQLETDRVKAIVDLEKVKQLGGFRG